MVFIFLNMDNKQIIDKIQKYSVNSYYSENNNKIAIKLYSNIGIWFYLIIYKTGDKIQDLCKYKTADKITWNIIELKKFYKIFVRKKFEFIDLSKTKPKELKNINADYSVKFDGIKINVFIKQDDLFIDFHKFGYYIKCKNFKQLYFAVKNIDEKPEVILKLFLVKELYKLHYKRYYNKNQVIKTNKDNSEYVIKCKRRSKNGIIDSTEKININDYVTNQYLLEMFSELVKKYKI